MAFTNYIQQITATNGTTHDLVDSSASHYVKGTQTSSTNAWTGALPDGVSAYYDGLSIDYFLPYAGTSNGATLNLGSKGAKPVYIGNSATQATTHYPQYSVIHLTYIVNSGLNSGNGCWKATGYYDTNTTAWSGISGKPTATGSSATGISIAAHGTTSVGSASNWSAGSASNWAFEDVACDDITSWSAGSASNWSFSGVTVANSISGAVDSSDNSMLVISLGTTTVQSKSGGGNGTAPSLSYSAKTTSHVKSGGNGTAPSLTITSTTVTNGTSHSVTDPKHTHTIS